MNQQIRVLKTLQGYDAAISRLSALMDIDFSESSVEESEFKLLWLVIKSYENIVTPPVIPDPIDGILFVMEQKSIWDGAAMLCGDTPIVTLTLRHDRIDNFWFALLHELVHVHKHLTPDYAFIADTLNDKTRTSQQAGKRMKAHAMH